MRRIGAGLTGAGAMALMLALASGAFASPGVPEVLARVGNLTIPAGTIVHGAATAIGGSLDVEGTVEGDAIAIGGGVEVGGRVTGSVRALGGDVRLRSTAVVGGTATAWGGRVRIDPGTSLGTPPPAQPPGAPSTPSPGPPVPAPPGPAVPIPDTSSAWWLPGIFGLLWVFHTLYWVIALPVLVGFVVTAWLTAVLFPGTLAALAGDLERSPAAAFVSGLIGWVGVWLAMVLLAVSVVGLAFVILIPAAILIMLQFGITAVALLAGRRIRPSGIGREVLVGSVMLSIAFAIPHLGWLFMLAVATWGWGVVLLALFEWLRARRLPPPPAPA